MENYLNNWEFLFVRYEIDNQEERIYVNGDLRKRKSLKGVFGGSVKPELLYNFTASLGCIGWDLQADWYDGKARNLTFKKPTNQEQYSKSFQAEQNSQDNYGRLKDNSEIFNTGQLGKLNKELNQIKVEVIEALSEIKEKLNSIEFFIKTIPERKLVSSLVIDYTQLRDLLAVGNWREADRETYKILISASKREEYGWLDTESIKNLASNDLLTINRLWVEYSNGHFGYSIQKRMLGTLVNKSKEQHDSIKKQFGELVGWRVKEEWLKYKQLTFELNAPQGHLPTVNIGWGTEGDWLRYSEFLSRRVF